jgi:hypothetical protein
MAAVENDALSELLATIIIIAKEASLLPNGDAHLTTSICNFIAFPRNFRIWQRIVVATPTKW